MHGSLTRKLVKVKMNLAGSGTEWRSWPGSFVLLGESKTMLATHNHKILVAGGVFVAGSKSPDEYSSPEIGIATPVRAQAGTLSAAGYVQNWRKSELALQATHPMNN